MLSIFLTSLPLFLIIGAGVLLRQLKLADDNWTTVLNQYVLYAAFPCFIIKSLLDAGGAVIPAHEILFNLLLLNAALFGIYALVRLLRGGKPLAAAFAICGVYGNIAYMGMPFITSVNPGSETVVTLHVAVYVFVLFTTGLLLLETSTGNPAHPLRIMAGLFKNPLFMTVPVGFILAALQVKLPVPVYKAMGMLGGSTSTVVLLALGVFVGRGFSVNSSLAKAAGLTAIKLALLPALFVVANRFLSPDTVVWRTSVLEAAMPVGLTGFALTQRYPLDRDTIAQAVILSTLLSMITLPLLAAW